MHKIVTVYLWRSKSPMNRPDHTPRIFTTITPDYRRDAELMGSSSVTITEGVFSKLDQRLV